MASNATVSISRTLVTQRDAMGNIIETQRIERGLDPTTVVIARADFEKLVASLESTRAELATTRDALVKAIGSAVGALGKRIDETQTSGLQTRGMVRAVAHALGITNIEIAEGK